MSTFSPVMSSVIAQKLSYLLLNGRISIPVRQTASRDLYYRSLNFYSNMQSTAWAEASCLARKPSLYSHFAFSCLGGNSVSG